MPAHNSPKLPAMLHRTHIAIARGRYWIALLAGILLLGQVLHLHTHLFADHLLSYGHTHAAEVHAAVMPTTNAYGDGAIEEAGIAPEGILKLIGGALLIAPLVAVLLLVAPPRQRIGHRELRLLCPTSPPLLRPPLRAPPR
jgi:hypothetical protein